MNKTIRKIINTLRVFATRELVFTFDKIEFHYTGLSWKRIWNWFVAELSYDLNTKRVWAYPTHIQFEPSMACNLSCPMCYVTTHKVKGGLLSLDNFRKVIDEVGDYMLFLHFWGWGEPFMNKDIYPMIRYAKEKGLKVITSTNGHFLSSVEDIDSLIDSGLDAIIFAMDGADRETYEKYRHKGDFDKMLDNLRLLVKRRMEKGADSPVINLRMVVTRENEDQVSQMREFAADVGVDMLSLKTLGSHDDEILWNESLPRNHEYRRFEYDDADKVILKRNTCKRMWHHPFISNDGTVALCCYHLPGEVPVGNAFASNGDGFAKVWFGEEYRRARAGFMAFRGGEGHSGPKRCRTCNTNYTNNWDYVSHAFYLRDNGKTS